MANADDTPKAGAPAATTSIDKSAKTASVTALIPAPPEEIFAVLADPSLHPVIDGSGTVKGSRDAQPSRLELGSTFDMNMRMGVPYKIGNKVVEFEENRLIAWQHMGRHRWRYELEPVDGGTLVTETFDWSHAPAGKVYEVLGLPNRHTSAMAKTLANLADFLENRSQSL